jgi:PAT family beta-lactamase induction signal transducer AmpG
MLAAISLYRLADFVMGPMAAPFYTDLGLSTDTVGGVRLSVGLVASFLGIAAAGLSAVRLGPARTLVLGAVLGPLSNLAFTAMALSGPSVALFAAAIAVDNLSAGFSGAALVAYMSGLTSRGYTATQYALLSSTYSVLGKLAKGLSGTAVEWLHQGRGLLEAYAWFFAATALIGVPAIALSLVLGRHADQLEPAAPP